MSNIDYVFQHYVQRDEAPKTPIATCGVININESFPLGNGAFEFISLSAINISPPRKKKMN